jgi:hypothetical protein
LRVAKLMIHTTIQELQQNWLRRIGCAGLAAPGTLGQHDRSDRQAAALELPHACIRGWSPQEERRHSGSGFTFVSDHPNENVFNLLCLMSIV